MNIVVLTGGTSSERDVSLSSGTLIHKALIEKGHHAILIDVCEDLPLIDSEALFESQKNFIGDAVITAKPFILNESHLSKKGYFGQHVLDICKKADVVFIAMHGANAEDGKIQAVFDLYGITYTGSGSFASGLAMDKAIAKQLFMQNNIPTAKSITITKHDKIEDIDIPCVVKPINGGSSIGVTIVKNHAELEESLKEAFLFCDQVLIEDFISGREFSVGILDRDVLPIIEICMEEGFYDYFNKYHTEKVSEITPAPIDENKAKEMSELALKAYDVLGLKNYARIDFMMDETGNLYCLEANSLPGMTPSSLLPQEALAVGIDFAEVCEKIVCYALDHRV
ncbi:MAG: D-alanine--D-alanine ligase [Beduini sp.]|uniref:D-alanine--D-alanine ligase family protein n=1 Tax=Beduini sp. TaxID=1922300 RepID=UPI0011C8CC72